MRASVTSEIAASVNAIEVLIAPRTADDREENGNCRSRSAPGDACHGCFYSIG
jgi:hypothetical protein